MKIKVTVISLILSFACISCFNKSDENFEDISKIKKGMSVKDARQIMRNKYIDQSTAHYDNNLIVESYESDALVSDRYKIIFRKSDSTIVDVGLGD
ncbi:MAG: hypothetical protein EOO46_03780 [Flavobacterium sp.]|nr:MAG: hypothetical protein EOO46_03780 [Flavobacterium sp.]